MRIVGRLLVSTTRLERTKERFDRVSPFLDEKQRRLFAASEAMAYGNGAVSSVAKALGMSPITVTAGIRELQEPESIVVNRVRKPGGGRKRRVDTDPTLRSDLEAIVDYSTRGDPESPLRWTCKSLRRLSAELNAMGHQTSAPTIGILLHELGYSLQANKKTLEGAAAHPDRDEQFKYISTTTQEFQKASQPVISVDTKKKELVGNFKNGGAEYRHEHDPELVEGHDFAKKELGKVSPYGVYDTTLNNAWVSVGTDHDTGAFAVASIGQWWDSMGKEAYPEATQLFITADGGGSNGSRCRLWKISLQEFANKTGLTITVSHFPPGTSKWNKIEHRLFSHITMNWRAKPLVSHETIVSLIAATTTSKGLKVRCKLDKTKYPTGIKVTDKELAQVNVKHKNFHGEWNYVISPTA